MSTEFEPTALQMLVCEVKKTGTSAYSGVMLPVAARLDVKNFPMVEALTAHLGTSRNKVINDLLAVGIETLLSGLSAEVVDDLNKNAQTQYEKVKEKLTTGQY